MLSTNFPSQILASELQPDEQILWSGQPDPLTTMLSQYPVALFGLVWTAFSMTGLVSMSRDGAIFGTAVLLVFVSIGIFMLAKPLIEYRKAKSTVFAITNGRFLMLTGGGRAMRSVQLSAVRQVDRVTRLGRLTLRIPTALVSDQDGPKVDYTELHGIPDAERAFRLLTQPLR